MVRVRDQAFVVGMEGEQWRSIETNSIDGQCNVGDDHFLCFGLKQMEMVLKKMKGKYVLQGWYKEDTKTLEQWAYLGTYKVFYAGKITKYFH